MSSLVSGDEVPTGGVLGPGETPSSSAMFLEDDGVQNVSGAHARVTLQKAKDTLRRSEGIGQPVKLSLLDRVRSAMPTIGEARVRGWLWYHRKYINVKKGGVGGVSMLLVGYCVLSYAWKYPHIKWERWRKYH
ncbi:hypothetical protein CRUP_026311 [Coryphaenoides rupestris]|nr:hypothetical protein CRUP_026311 [Coryphaenoides rupestris]